MKYTFLVTAFFFEILASNAFAVTCDPISAGASIVITSSCSGLEITAGGNVSTSSGVTIDDANAPSSYHSVKINSGNTTSFINYGAITQALGVGNLWNAGILDVLNNQGTMSISGANHHNVLNTNSISLLRNSGSMLSSGTYSEGIYNYGSGSSISSLINAGTIEVGHQSTAVKNEGSILSVNNSGVIQGGARGLYS